MVGVSIMKKMLPFLTISVEDQFQFQYFMLQDNKKNQ